MTTCRSGVRAVVACCAWCRLCFPGYCQQPIAATGTARTSSPARPSLGAIRWDGWFQDNPWQRNLDPQQWHDRVPFYGRVVSDNRVEVCGDSSEAMDQEIAYAKAAGLDYWAFLHYHPASWEGADKYNYGLRRYLASAEGGCQFLCHHLPVAPRPWTEQVAFVAQVVQEPSYHKVAAGRPLVVLLAWGEGAMPEKIWGNAAESRAVWTSCERRFNRLVRRIRTLSSRPWIRFGVRSTSNSWAWMPSVSTRTGRVGAMPISRQRT